MPQSPAPTPTPEAARAAREFLGSQPEALVLALAQTLDAFANRHDPEMTSFLRGVVGGVEANSYEYHTLWAENGRRPHPKAWEQISPSRLETIGHIDDMPVCVSLLKAMVGGHLILFLHPTSQVVDHRMIDLWLTSSLPDSARKENGYPNRTDAMNFYNIFPPNQR